MGRPCSFSRITSSRPGGRARLPTCVARMRCVLRCMVLGGSLRSYSQTGISSGGGTFTSVTRLR